LKSSEAKARLESDPDFIYSKRFEFSLQMLLEKHPDGVSDRIAAAALMVTEDDVKDIYDGIVAKLRAAMKVE
jgi:hypothetical protein